ncbi:MAG TPA: type I secretion C-terminal target domain-containing protein, partial [Rhodospirillales bacterium]|nr:type I secretion C-terminal target domain-containing protein [Rhodospirillales bacterium]
FGGNGWDWLAGDAGADRLNGGAGPDTLFGGSGADVFDYDAASDSTVRWTGRDMIIGFDGAGAAPGDRIDLSDIFAGELAFRRGAFTAIGQLHVVENGDGSSRVEANLTGALGADFAVLIIDGTTLASAYSAQDFFL